MSNEQHNARQRDQMTARDATLLTILGLVTGAIGLMNDLVGLFAIDHPLPLILGFGLLLCAPLWYALRGRQRIVKWLARLSIPLLILGFSLVLTTIRAPKDQDMPLGENVTIFTFDDETQSGCPHCSGI